MTNADKFLKSDANYKVLSASITDVLVSLLSLEEYEEKIYETINDFFRNGG